MKQRRVLAISAALVLMTSAGFTADTEQETEPSHEELVRLEAERKATAEAASQDFRKRAVPLMTAGEFDETGQLKMRALRDYYHMSYPTGTIPSQPWTRAMEHVRQNVPDSEPWRLDGLAPLDPGQTRAPVDPGVNAWVSYGPEPLDATGTTNNAWQYGVVAGRVTHIVVDDVSPNVIWASFAAGGLWRSTDSGTTFVPMWEDRDFVTQAASAITIDYAADGTGNTVWVGTGDWPARDQFSSGIMYTENALEANPDDVVWTLFGADVFTPFSKTVPPSQANGGCAGCLGNRWDNQNIKAVVVDPANTDTILVGTRYNLYMSSDRGATWDLCRVDDNNSVWTDPESSVGTTMAIERISSIVLDDRGGSSPGDTVAYVAVGFLTAANNQSNGVYKFDIPADGSCPDHTSDITDVSSGLPSLANLGRIELAVGEVDASNFRLYAQVQNAGGPPYDAQGIWTVNLGASGNPFGSWSFIANTEAGSVQQCNGQTSGSGQDWYDLHLSIDPSNDKNIYSGHISVWDGVVNGTYTDMASWEDIGDVYAGSGCDEHRQLHPDAHTGDFIPGGGGASDWDFVHGSDGGINVWDTSVGDLAWTQLNTTISTNQFYAGQIGMDFGGAGNVVDGKQWVLGGMQDNGCASWDSSGGPSPITGSNLEWTARGWGGDGMWTAFDAWAGTETAGRWYTESQNGNLNYSTTGANGPVVSSSGYGAGESPDWSMPFMLDNFHCTRDTASSATGTCTNFFVGVDSVWASTVDGPPSYTKISPLLPGSAGAGSIVSLNLAQGNPKSLTAATDNGRWWWTETALSGANCTQAAANTQNFSCTANAGATWFEVTSGILPNRAIDGVAADPSDHNTIYAAYNGFDENTPSEPGHLFQAVHTGGGSFTVKNKTGNLPNVPMAAVIVNPHDPEMVFVGTYKGFYFTANINDSQPHWQRYMEGMPNTRIDHLVIDRGPEESPVDPTSAYESTTLGAFTYGRGFYAIRLPGAGGGLADSIFTDGFESGDVSVWSSSNP